MEQNKQSATVLESGIVKTSSGNEYYRVRVKSKQQIPIVPFKKKDIFQKLFSFLK